MDDKRNAISIRTQFGRNLRVLCTAYPSVSEVCRQLKINRAQFNRYLNGESYPRPDMLARICDFFDTDARILTDPLETLATSPPDLISHPEIRDYSAQYSTRLSEDQFPTGFYRFTRQSFLFSERFIMGLVYIYRKDGWTFLKGSEARQSVQAQGLPDDPDVRQFKGYLQAIDGGIAAMVSRRNAMTYTFNFLSPVASFDRNYWHGYSARTVNEALNSKRVTRTVYEHLGKSSKLILQTARSRGFCEVSDLPPYHQHLLRAEEPFF